MIELGAETFHNIATDNMQAAGSIVVAMVAHGKDHKTSWPFVTLSSFQQRAATVKDLVSISTLTYRKNRSPIVLESVGMASNVLCLVRLSPFNAERRTLRRI